MRVPACIEGRYGDLIERIIATADRPERQRDPPEDPYGGYVLGWRIESSTTTERRRGRMRHSDGRSVHTSELQGRHRDHSSRIETGSNNPYGSATSEELRLRQPLSRPLSSEEL
jgi:hypothetical protein